MTEPKDAMSVSYLGTPEVKVPASKRFPRITASQEFCTR